jgi:ankyrin repeat protein
MSYSIVLAANANNIERVRECIASGQDINMRWKGFGDWTPLMFAALNGNFNMVHALIIAGADVNLTSDHFGTTALKLACGTPCWSTEIVKLLLEHGADANFRNSLDRNALDIASIKRHREIVAVLFNHMFGEVLVKVLDRDLLAVICEFV